ncbi:MAG: N-acetylmuramoyl-L-alanine amidase [Propionibacteriales bacterium]|nr:N-acetylmuramoyl-L-alanine amidase [Propionibacteriales bacterium]
MIRARGLAVAFAAAGLLVALAPSLAASERQPAAAGARDEAAPRAAALPLTGIRIALDPGHQLGNHNFPTEINRPVPAGGFTKPCNTTGTATSSGYPESTFAFAVATGVKRRLEALGATVRMTRTSNSERLWGPCVNKRGAFGGSVGAVLEVSLHGDGSTRAGARGFHVIAPVSRAPWTDDIAVRSLRLAKALRYGLDQRNVPRSTYLAGGTGLVKRSDLGTLNLSDVPIAMIELGNMRNHQDAALMKSSDGRAVYASAVVLGIRTYLHR